MDIVIEDGVLPVHPWTGLRALAVLPSGRAVWPVFGGAEDDDAPEEGQDGDVEEQSDDDQGDADTGGDAEESKEKGDDKVSRGELTKAIAARDRAKKELRDKNRELEELRRKNEDADQTAAREAREAAQAEADAKYKPISVRAGLLEAGVRPGRVKGALKLLDLSEIDIDDDGEVTGLDAQLDSLRKEWPELFADPEAEKKPERRVPRGGADGADKKPQVKELTASEQQAAKLLGKS